MYLIRSKAESIDPCLSTYSSLYDPISPLHRLKRNPHIPTPSTCHEYHISRDFSVALSSEFSMNPMRSVINSSWNSYVTKGRFGFSGSHSSPTAFGLYVQRNILKKKSGSSAHCLMSMSANSGSFSAFRRSVARCLRFSSGSLLYSIFLFF